MDRILDLDEAAAVLTGRSRTWRTAGLDVSPLTWRDAAAPWPARLETDRSRVHDPDAVGVHLAASRAELSVVLFTGGWRTSTTSRRTATFSTHRPPASPRRRTSPTGWRDGYTMRSAHRRPEPRWEPNSLRAGKRSVILW
ncbi:hypothetical protein GCM10010417_15790 [Streptomyces carpaticus]